ncbi:MAG: siphovirus ReqiPepy6 Gp37-like family protein, partial [Oscillospiraceae bacterium]
SLQWRRKFFTAGEFELHFNLTAKNKHLLGDGNIVCRTDSPEAGIVEIQRLQDDGDGDKAMVKGSFITAALARRYLYGQETAIGKAEEVMRQWVNKLAINPSNADRKMAKIELGTLQGFPEGISAQTSDAELLQALTDVGKVSGLGYRLRFDRFVQTVFFEVLKGVDRSISQQLNPRIIFSDEMHNIKSTEYELKTNRYKTYVVVGGETVEGVPQKRVAVGGGSGWERRETYCDASGTSSADLTEAQYEDVLRNEGQLNLWSASRIENFEGKIATASEAMYGVDFELGDIVTVGQKKWGHYENLRITEVLEVFEKGRKTVAPTFGSPAPSIIDFVKGVR